MLTSVLLKLLISNYPRSKCALYCPLKLVLLYHTDHILEPHCFRATLGLSIDVFWCEMFLQV